MQGKSRPAKLFAILTSCSLTLGLMLILAACGGTTPTTTTGGGGKSPSDIHLGFVSETSSLNFASEMAAGAQYAANEFHVNAQIVAPPTVNDQAAVKLFQDLTRTASDGIAVETLAPNLFVRPEAQAVKDGIPVIAVDTIADPTTGITTYVGNDNIAAGALLVDEAVKHLPANASGTVIVGIDTPGVPVLTYRFQGIQEEFKRLLPNVQVLGPFDSKQEPNANYIAWSSLIKAHPNALAYLGVGDADNASLARLRQAQHGTYLTAAFDLNATGLQAVQDGVNYALIDPEHFLKGYVAMRLLIEHALHGTEIPKGWWNPGAQLVNQANVASIIARQATLATKGAYYQPIIDKEFANPTAQIKPYDQAK
ncbi:MAG TPA: substrate-binding domain-containing protein [Ktedonobacteraceae bacterium]|jgi:ribose transport system substrate-binding protein|nr:substrate-binding domain-containing protein [Ktedonobacteraceae bacterium]